MMIGGLCVAAVSQRMQDIKLGLQGGNQTDDVRLDFIKFAECDRRYSTTCA